MSKVRCNNCMSVFEEEEIVCNEDDKEYCPICGKDGCLMDLEIDEENDERKTYPLMSKNYRVGREEIKVGEEYYFGQLWDGEGDGEELLKDGCIGMWNDSKPYDPYNDNWEIVNFKIVKNDDNILNTVVKVLDIG